MRTTTLFLLALLLFVASACTPRGGRGRGGDEEENNAPTAPEVEIDPASPGVDDDLTLVIVTESTDEDGDNITYEINWTLNGDPVDDLEDPMLVPAARTALDDVWSVTVAATDGDDDSDLASASVTVANAAPVVDSVSVTAGAVYTNDVIEVTASASDSEGDAVTLSYEWYVNGSLVAEAVTSIDGATYFDKHDEVYVVVTPSDEFGVGAAEQSSTVTVLNSEPSAPSVSVSPTSPGAGEDDLWCQITSQSIDADGDTITYDFVWDWNGNVWGAPETTTYPGDTVAGTNTIEGETWTCTVTATDGEATTAPVSDGVVVVSPLPDLIVTGGLTGVTNGTFIFDEVRVLSGGTLRVEGPVTIQANVFEVDASSLVTADGEGHGADAGPEAGSPSSVPNAGSGGGGHGGAGGDGGYDSGDSRGPGGSSHGSPVSVEALMGSGGGSATDDVGGAGGGALWVIAADIDIAGTVSAAGEDGGSQPDCGSAGRCAGGGAGGTVLLQGDSIVVTGVIDVSGGDGNPGNSASNDSGGGGGGGRIKVFWDTVYDNSLAVFEVAGGAGGPNGSAGGGEDGGDGSNANAVMPF